MARERAGMLPGSSANWKVSFHSHLSYTGPMDKSLGFAHKSNRASCNLCCDLVIPNADILWDDSFLCYELENMIWKVI